MPLVSNSRKNCQESGSPAMGRAGVTRAIAIGVSGSAGTGKSTLCQALAERLAAPYVPEGMRERLEAGLDLHRLDRLELRDLLLELFDEMVSSLDSHRLAGSGCVCDRSPLDYAAFWLYYGFGSDDAATRDFLAAAERAAKSFDLVVLLPWGTLPLVADGVRSANRWRQLHFQAILEGLAFRSFGADHHHCLPPEITRQEDRVTWVLERSATLFDGERGAR